MHIDTKTSYFEEKVHTNVRESRTLVGDADRFQDLLSRLMEMKRS